MEREVNAQLLAVERQRIVDIESSFSSLFGHVEGVPSGWFDAERMVSLVSPSEYTALQERSELMNGVLLRIDVAEREVSALRRDKKASIEVAREYRSKKNRLKQLKSVSQFSSFGNVPNAVIAELIQQVDNGVGPINYEEEKARWVNRQVKDAMGDGCEAITAPSTNPDVVELEKKMKKEFGVRVNFGDNINLAQQTYAVCAKAQSFGHKFPSEIIFFNTPEEYCRAASFRSKARPGCIIIANVDPDPTSVAHTNALVVDASFQGILFHELGHFNPKAHVGSSIEEKIHGFSVKLKESFNVAVEEFVSTLPNPGNEDLVQELRTAVRAEADVNKIINICGKKLSRDDMHRLLATITLELNEFVDERRDCWGKRIAKEVSLYAATGGNEFMAEVYCGCMLGKSYSPEIMEIYKLNGGQLFA
ncbi:MAG: hypothetical protein LBS22_03695 [Puniceicoccales bacterium]|jgi:hypothetical protein|nr:hypothetical protein [Puniceicoccales bacterium]